MSLKKLTLLGALIAGVVTFVITQNPMNSIGVGTAALIVISIGISIWTTIRDRRAKVAEPAE